MMSNQILDKLPLYFNNITKFHNKAVIAAYKIATGQWNMVQDRSQ
jgi:hypothetical protein